MRLVKLNLSLQDFEAMHELVSGKSKTARVSADMLRNLLMDHGRVLSVLDRLNIHTTEPEYRQSKHVPATQETDI